eukprot:44900-Prymnesium_polylepis.1
MPEPSSSFLRSSFHSALPYVLVISIWKQSNDDMDAASRESDWRPEPPTPSSSAVATRDARRPVNRRRRGR